MDLQTVEIPRAAAREKAAEYSRMARRTRDSEARREMEDIARAYRFAAKDEVALIALSPTIEAGGTMQRTRVENKGTQWERREQTLLPRLAAIQAAARFCYTRGVEQNGNISFVDRLYPQHNLVHGRLKAETKFTLPSGFTAGGEIDTYTGSAWQSMVPITPPKQRPRANADLSTYVILWEVENWSWATERPPAPRDPALLRHVGGDIYAVLATWDLTELERLVLSGRRP